MKTARNGGTIDRAGIFRILHGVRSLAERLKDILTLAKDQS